MTKRRVLLFPFEVLVTGNSSLQKIYDTKIWQNSNCILTNLESDKIYNVLISTTDNFTITDIPAKTYKKGRYILHRLQNYLSVCLATYVAT